MWRGTINGKELDMKIFTAAFYTDTDWPACKMSINGPSLEFAGTSASKWLQSRMNKMFVGVEVYELGNDGPIDNTVLVYELVETRGVETRGVVRIKP